MRATWVIYTIYLYLYLYIYIYIYISYIYIYIYIIYLYIHRMLIYTSYVYINMATWGRPICSCEQHGLWTSHITWMNLNDSCNTSEWINTNETSHAPKVVQSVNDHSCGFECVTSYEWVMAHAWMSHVIIHTNESTRNTDEYEWVMSHTWGDLGLATPHVTHLWQVWGGYD